MLAKIKNLIKYGKITKAGDDTKAFPVQQITYNGKTVDCLILNPFGYHANLDIDALVAVLAVEGDESNRFAVGGYTPTRPACDIGETVIFHPETQSYIKFTKTGAIAINTASKDVNITATNVNITGNLTVTGDMQIDGASTLGAGGAAIARVGDAVLVTVAGGSSAGPASGTITAGSANNTAN